MKFDLIFGLIAAFIDAPLLSAACKWVAVIALGSVSVSQALPQTCCWWWLGQSQELVWQLAHKDKVQYNHTRWQSLIERHPKNPYNLQLSSFATHIASMKRSLQKGGTMPEKTRSGALKRPSPRSNSVNESDKSDFVETLTGLMVIYKNMDTFLE